MVQRFILNETSYFGPGARKVLPEVIDRLGKKKALVVTDKGLIQFGVAKMVTDVLDEAGVAYEIFSEVKPNPTVTNVKDGVAAFKAAQADRQWIPPKVSVLSWPILISPTSCRSKAARRPKTRAYRW